MQAWRRIYATDQCNRQ